VRTASSERCGLRPGHGLLKRRVLRTQRWCAYVRPAPAGRRNLHDQLRVRQRHLRAADGPRRSHLRHPFLRWCL